MKKFKDFDKLEDTKDDSPPADNLVNIIANSLNRARGKDDSKTMLALIAALSLLNVSKEDFPLSVARRLATTIKNNK
jgi:hypothetical protein